MAAATATGSIREVPGRPAVTAEGPPAILAWRAYPLFFLPIVALVVALLLDRFVALDYVYVMSGALWTGFDIFMGIVIGPILGRMSGPARADFVQRLVPTMLFRMPTLASVTITAGSYLAIMDGIFNLNYLAIQQDRPGSRAWQHFRAPDGKVYELCYDPS
jgi:hypothetical protein